MPPVILIVGSSGSGKTTLIERLIPELEGHGVSIASVKHAHHGFRVDRDGSDSDRHAASGATPVLLVSEDKAVAIWHRDAPRTSDLIDTLMGHADLVVAEGHGSLSGPKILVQRKGVKPRKLLDPENVIAAVTDESLGFDVEFGHDDAAALAKFIVETLSLATDGP